MLVLNLGSVSWFIFRLIFIFYVYLCEGMLHVASRAHEGQKRASHPLEVGFRVVMNCPMWVLGTQPRSAGRTGSALNCWTVLLSYCWVGKTIGHIGLVLQSFPKIVLHPATQRWRTLIFSWVPHWVVFGVSRPAHQIVCTQWPSCPCLFIQLNVLLQHQSQSRGGQTWLLLRLQPWHLPVYNKQSLAD